MINWTVFSKRFALILILVLFLPFHSSALAQEQYVSDNSVRPDPLAGVKQAGNVSVGEFTGAAVYSYPISLPAGRNGLTPQLSVTHNSQDGSLSNFLGYRWSVTEFSIMRENERGVDQLYERDDFIVNAPFASGELVSLNQPGLYGEKYASSFARYELRPDNTWIVTDRAGMRYTFGLSEEARQFDLNDSDRIYKWMLEEVRDTSDNIIRYRYQKIGNQLYPHLIEYGINGASDPIFRVEFDLRSDERPDYQYSYATGFLVETDYLIEGISVFADDQLRHEYTFNYTQIEPMVRQVLESIEDRAYNVSGEVVSLPPTRFEYSPSEISWELSDDYEVGIDFATCYMGFCGSNSISNFWDMTGDGLVDFPLGQFPNNIIYENNGQSGFNLLNENIPIIPSAVPTLDLKMTDFDGDLRMDFISSHYNRYDVLNSSVQLNRPGQSIADPLDIGFATSSTRYPDNGAAVGDLNGDGLPDIIQRRVHLLDTQTIDENRTCLNQDGNQCRSTDLWQSPVSFATINVLSNNPRNHYLQDCNRDGLADVLSQSDRFVNDGQGGWIPGDERCAVTGEDNIFRRSVDLNGDGLPDKVYSGIRASLHRDYWDREVDLNTGLGNSRIDVDFPVPFTSSTGNPTSDTQGVRLMDINGDKLPDVVQNFRNTYQQGGDNVTEFTKNVWLHTGSRPYFLTKVYTSTGSEITLDYKTSTQYQRADGSQANPNLPLIVDTISRMTVSDGQGNISTTDYHYEDGHYHYDHAYERSLAGFGLVSKINQDGHETRTFYHQGQYSLDQSALGEFEDHISKKGRVYRQEFYDENGFKLTQNLSRFEHRVLGVDRYFAYPSQSVSQSFNGGVEKTTAQSFVYDSVGNQIEVTDFGEVTLTSQAGDFNDIESDLLRTVNVFIDETVYVSSSEVFDVNGSSLGRSRQYYDYLPLGSVTRGYLTAQESWLDTSNSWLRSENNYNDFGLLISQVNPRGFISYTEYDSYNLYPSEITNAKGFRSQMDYDIGIGQMISMTDLNGVEMEYEYDGYGRRLSETRNGDLLSRQVYNDFSSPRSVHSTLYNDNGTTVESYTYFDNLDRAIESKAAFGNGQWVSSQTIYDARGLVSKTNQAYLSNTPNFEALNEGLIGTHFTYDALSRPVQVVDPLGTSRNEYMGFDVLSFDREGNQKRFYNDVRGNLIGVDEFNEGTIYQTRYTYDPLSRLVLVNDAENNQRSFAYDSLGRRLSQTKLGSTLSWNYRYDANGNLIEKSDPKNQVVEYAYDELDRVLVEDFTGIVGPELVYTYDAPGSLGLLERVNAVNYEHAFVYDALGRVITDQKQIEDKSYAVDYVYDQLGAVRSMTYPDGFVLDYDYNEAQQLERVYSGDQVYAQNFAYTPLGQTASFTLGNGVEIQNTYDPAKAYQLQAKQATFGGESLQNLSYSYDRLGNITQLLDQAVSITAKQVDYAYDDLSRLQTASYSGLASGDDFAEQFTYSPVGNMLSKSDVGDYFYNNEHPHAVTQAGDLVFDYDANGNMSLRNESEMIYDYRNRLLESVGEARFTYGEGYDRLTKFDVLNNETTYYAFKYFEEHANKQVKYLYAGALRIGKIEVAVGNEEMGDGSEDDEDNEGGEEEDSEAEDDSGEDEEGDNSNDNPSTPSAPQIPTAPAPTSRRGGGGYRSPDHLKIMMLIREGQQEEAEKLSAKTYHHQLNALANENKVPLKSEALESSAFENLRIKYNKKDALIIWDAMPETIDSFKIYRSKGKNPLVDEDPSVLVGEMKASRFKNRFYDRDFDDFARYSYKIVAFNRRGHSVLTSFTLHSKQIFVREGVRKIVDFRNFSDADFDSVRIVSNEYVDGFETSIPQRLFIVPDEAMDSGARVTVRFLSCLSKKDGSKYCTRVDNQLVEVHVLKPSNPVREYLSYVGRAFASLIPSAMAQESDNTETFYFVENHLGSINLVLDDEGNVVERRDYLSYGIERVSESGSNSTETEADFTGQKLDEETNLHYYNARYYDGELGRFVSVDPLVLDEAVMTEKDLLSILSNPQALNYYAYVLNNPVLYIDPFGESADSISERIAGFGQAIDGAKGLISAAAGYVLSAYSKDVKLTVTTAGYSTSLGANGLADVYEGVSQVFTGEISYESKLEEIGNSFIKKTPISVTKTNPVLKFILGNANEFNRTEEAFERLGNYIEEEARWVIPVDTSRLSKPLENTEIIQGPITITDKVEAFYDTVKGKIDNFITSD